MPGEDGAVSFCRLFTTKLGYFYENDGLCAKDNRVILRNPTVLTNKTAFGV
jgi:hypothetical protein